jgi:exonuclease SbcC
MLPLKLKLRNFLSYGDFIQEVSFEGRSIICLSGNNGNGKSALLEAITWSLWGFARKNQGITKSDDSVMRIGSSYMLVSLEFLVNSDCFIVRRTAEKKYKRLTTELRLFSLDKNGEIKDLTLSSQKETQGLIDKIIGIDYETFINTVFLKQGSYNEFSKRSPKERKDILCKILGIDKIENVRQNIIDDLKKINFELSAISNIFSSIKLNIDEKDLVSMKESLYKKKEIYQDKKKETFDLKNNIKNKEEELKEKELLIFNFIDNEKLIQNVLFEKYHIYKNNIQKRIKKYQLYCYINKFKNENNLLEINFDNKLFSLKDNLSIINKEIIQKNDFFYKSKLDIKSNFDISFNLYQNEIKALEEKNKYFEDEISQLNKEFEMLENEIKIVQNFILKNENNFNNEINFCNIILNKINLFIFKIINLMNKKKSILNKNNICLDELFICSDKCVFCGAFIDEKSKEFIFKNLNRKNEYLNSLIEIYNKRLMKYNLKKNGIEKKLEILKKEEINFKGNLEKNNAIILKIEEKKLFLKKINAEKILISAALLKINDLIKLLESDYIICLKELEKTFDNENKILIEKKEKLINEEKELSKKFSEYILYNEKLKELEKEKIFIGKDKIILNIKEIRLLKNEINKNLKEKAVLLDIKKKDDMFLNINKKKLEDLELIVHEFYTSLIEEHSNYTLLERQFNENKEQRAKLEIQINELQEQSSIKTDLASILSKDSIQAALIEESIPQIEYEANNILSVLTNNSSRINIESMRDLKSGKIKETLDIVISDNFGSRAYEFFSGGEAFRIDLSIRIALSKVLFRRSGSKMRVFIIDEGFGSQDSSALETIIQSIFLLQDEFDLIIIVSHLSEMKEQFPVQFFVQKTLSGSEISIIEN